MRDLEEALRRLTLHDDRYLEAALGETPSDASFGVDRKTLALARVAALVATGGSLGSYVAHVEAALMEGASPEEIVGVVIGVAHDVGETRAVAAASSVGAALGIDVTV
jgi:alkylhydroperoxidase/carboxymuconolactone decarboxylase family protein YurZ